MLFAISSLVLAYFHFLGLGSLLAPLWKNAPARQLNATFLVCGLALQHALSLAIPRLSVSWWIGALFAVLGLAMGLRSPQGWREKLWPYPWRVSAVVVLTLVCFTRHALSFPITEWDARSIWFFHGKILYALDSLQRTDVWSDPLLAFSHPAYPKILPSLAALAGRLGGSWNDYFPKLAYGLLALPAVFTLGSLKDKFWPLAWLWFALFFSQYRSLDYGYADGFHALYAALALLFIARGLQSHRSLDFFQGAACLAVACQIKNEGSLVLAALALLLLGYGMRRRVRSIPPALLGSVAAVFSGYILWICVCWWGGITEQQPLVGHGFFARVADRLSSGLPVLLQRFFITYKLGIYAAIVLAAAIAGRLAGARPLPWVFLVGAPALFIVGLSLVYLGTPYDFGWHVGTSIDRTALVPRAFLVVGAYLAFSRLAGLKVEAQPETERAR